MPASIGNIPMIIDSGRVDRCSWRPGDVHYILYSMWRARLALHSVGGGEAIPDDADPVSILLLRGLVRVPIVEEAAV